MAKIRNNIPDSLGKWWRQRKRELEKELRIFAEKVANRVRTGYSGINRQGQDSGGWKQGKAPVDTGALAQSVRIDYTEIRKLKVRILIGKTYGAYVEFGTRNSAARPYLRMALLIEDRGNNFKTRVFFE